MYVYHFFYQEDTFGYFLQVSQSIIRFAGVGGDGEPIVGWTKIGPVDLSGYNFYGKFKNPLIFKGCFSICDIYLSTYLYHQISNKLFELVMFLPIRYSVWKLSLLTLSVFFFHSYIPC